MYGYCKDTSHNHCEHSYLRAASFVSLKAVAHWTPKGLTIFYQNSSKSVTKSVGSFFRGGGGGGGGHGKCQYVPEIVRNVPIWYISGRTHK